MAYNIKKGEINDSFVQKYLKNGSAINHGFLFDAVTQHAQKVVEQEEELLKEERQRGLMEAYIQSAKDWLQCIEDRK